MVSRIHVALKAEDRSYFAILKKQIHNLAASAGFGEARIGELDIVVAEMVSNLVKHAGGGQVLAKLIDEDGVQGIEIISIDNGPGMTDVTRMVADGVSTKNTLGQGLGAMKRMSDVFQVYSQKDWGTVILIRIFTEELSHFRKPSKEEVRSVVIPKPGEIECGDGFFYSANSGHIKIFLGDGLGHGPEAAKAVTEAGAAFLACAEVEPPEIIRCINNEVKKTRGLVGTIAVFDLHNRKWKICGVGNISTKIISPDNAKNVMSYNGIIGLNVPRTLNSQEISYEKGQYIIMCSDGIKTKWDPVKYGAIQRYDASILGASLLKDFARMTDDMSVAVCKINL
ncbi:MAG TPA: ATP-binding SpoIIE family protein phosphatase [Flavisolibacter sp.]|jgi:anti-sigma regulatory factor (Ser/Thr protein kinase)|nr:ATP-binding SpoIIE family protein phosphatase [Flavisolibacter sp.]